MTPVSDRFTLGNPKLTLVDWVLFTGKRPGYGPFPVNAPMPIRLKLCGFTGIPPAAKSFNASVMLPPQSPDAMNEQLDVAGLVGASESVAGVGTELTFERNPRTPS